MRISDWSSDVCSSDLRKLVINEAEAATVRHIFQRFVELGSATLLTRELVAGGTLNKRGKPIDKGFLYKLFRNRLYLGEAVHKGTSYPGENQTIIHEPHWDQVHAIQQESPPQRAANPRTPTTPLPHGLILYRKSAGQGNRGTI